MKPFPTLLLPLLLSAFLLLSTAAAAGEAAVRDINGNELRRGVGYHIMPTVLWNGGLTLARRNNTCPLNVAQAWSELDSGTPVTFFPADPDEKIIRLSADVNIKFSRNSSATTACPQSSTVWKFGGGGGGGRVYVTTGGVLGNPGCRTLGNWFSIHKYSHSYKIVFCPAVCDSHRPDLCGVLQTFREGSDIWVGLSKNVTAVSFQKVRN